MIRVLIVDSQKINLDKIKHYIQATNLDYQIVGEVQSAESAEDLLASSHVDLIIADDSLPKKTGLQLYNDNSEQYPTLHMILFTDYNRFNSTKELLSHGRIDFLFKPIRRNDVIKSMIHIAPLIKEAQLQSTNSRQLRVAYDDHFDVFKDRFLINLIHGHMENENVINDRLTYFKIPHQGSYTVGVAKIEDYRTYQLALDEDEKQFLIFNALNVIETFLNNHQLGFALINRYDEICFILTKPMDEETLMTALEEIQTALMTKNSIKVTMAIGRTYEQTSLIPTSYHQARAALRHSFYLGLGSIIHINYIAKNSDFAYDYPRDKEQLMVYETVNGHLDRSISLLNQIFSAHQSNKIFPDYYYQTLIIGILVNINRTAIENRVSIKGFFKSYIRLNEINTIDSPDSAHAYLKDALTQICDYQLLQQHKDQERLLHELKSYVHTYYASKISLRRAAQYLKTTPKYLERLIYLEENMNFYDFCMEVRLTVAQELLKSTDDSTGDIAAKIGFNNAEYFSAIFKQHFHMSPSTYRNDGSNVIRPHKLL